MSKIYIIANQNLRCPKSLTSSFLRNLIGAEIYCIKSQPVPLFRMERKGLQEIVTEYPLGNQLHEFIDFDFSTQQPQETGFVILTNSFSLCLRNPDHLWPEQMQGEFASIQPDLLWMEDRKERLRGSPFAVVKNGNTRLTYSVKKLITLPKHYSPIE